MQKMVWFTLHALFAVALCLQLSVGQSCANEYSVQIDPSTHQKFGLYYPATYKFKIPAGETGLSAQFRYSLSDVWRALPEKTSSDVFNGIDTVRYDYAGGWAYISIRFLNSSDHIYLRVIDKAAVPITIAFDSIPKYYDDRKAAVTVSLADWDEWDDDEVVAASNYLGSFGLYFTVGLITQNIHWPIVQQQIDRLGDKIEIGSHGAHHSCSASDYLSNGYQSEVVGSRDAIRNNLTYRAHPYVPVYDEPCGYTDATLESWITAGDYLLSRSAANDLLYGSKFISWDSLQERYGRAHYVFGDADYSDTVQLLNDANSLFDTAIAAGGIYHLADHPWQGLWHDGSYLLQHLNYIKGKSNLWYAPFGHFYQYHFLQERRGNLSIQPLVTASPVADFSALPLSGRSPLSVSFTDGSTGPISNWFWDFGDSATSSLQNPVHIYGSTGSYSVSLTVSGSEGSDTRTRGGYIVVDPATPSANFTASPLSGRPPLSVSFTDTSTGTIGSWFWDFGDSITSALQNPVHRYNRSGSYTVKLTVTGPGGSSTKTYQKYIKVRGK